jgi:hypothetical protein
MKLISANWLFNLINYWLLDIEDSYLPAFSMRFFKNYYIFSNQDPYGLQADPAGDGPKNIDLSKEDEMSRRLWENGN